MSFIALVIKLRSDAVTHHPDTGHVTTAVRGTAQHFKCYGERNKP